MGEERYTNEWYTPEKYIMAARSVMGDIDLDPASNEIANKVVQAQKIFTIEDNGLSKRWYGRVYLNPPFEDNGQKRWARYLLGQFEDGNVEQAILLVTANTEVGWFQPFYDFKICMIKGRLNYWTPTPDNFTRTHQSRFGTCFVYMGDQEEKFIKEFHQFGRVVSAVDGVNPRHKTLWDMSA